MIDQLSAGMLRNIRMLLLTKVIFRFWIYFFTKMLILALCSFLPIKSHLTSICTFPLSRFILRATRGPLLEASLCAILEIAPSLKLSAKRVRNSGSVYGFAVTQLGFYSLYSGRLNTVTELNGFHENANLATVGW